MDMITTFLASPVDDRLLVIEAEQAMVIRQAFARYLEELRRHKVECSDEAISNRINLLPVDTDLNEDQQEMVDRRFVHYARPQDRRAVDSGIQPLISRRAVQRFRTHGSPDASPSNRNQGNQSSGVIAAIRDFLVAKRKLHPAALQGPGRLMAPAYALRDAILSWELPAVEPDGLEAEDYWAIEPNGEGFLWLSARFEKVISHVYRLNIVSRRILRQPGAMTGAELERVCDPCDKGETVQFWVVVLNNFTLGFSNTKRPFQPAEVEIFSAVGSLRTAPISEKFVLERKYIDNLIPYAGLEAAAGESGLLRSSRVSAGGATHLIEFVRKDNLSKFAIHQAFVYNYENVYLPGGKRLYDDGYLTDNSVEGYVPDEDLGEKFIRLVRERGEVLIRRRPGDRDAITAEIVSLLEQGADVNQAEPDTGCRALHFAAAIADRELIRILIRQKDLDFLVRDKSGNFPLDVLVPYYPSSGDFRLRALERFFMKKTGQQAWNRGYGEQYAQQYWDSEPLNQVLPPWTPPEP